MNIKVSTARLQEIIFVFQYAVPILVCVHQKRWGSRPSSERAAARKVPVELQHPR